MDNDLMGQIPADHYWREDVLAQEVSDIFKPSWLCVAMVDDLKNDKDFVTAKIGHVSIVVQNFDGELRAFRNVCSHRFAMIQCEAQGNRPLSCPYHGWTYNAEGVPTGVPMNRQQFNFSDDDKRQLALETYALETVGHFVFIRMTPEGPTLREFLGAFHDELQHVSDMCPDRFEHNRYTWDCNWKLGLDNAAEGYHVPLIHPESFALILSLDLEITTDAEHSRYIGKLKERSLKWWDGVAKSTKMVKSERYPQYGNFIIFPNIVVTFSYGAFLTFQTFNPIDGQTCTLTSTAWLAKTKGTAARNMVVDALIDFSVRVRQEDADICAVAQKGVRASETRRPHILGHIEGRIAHFQKAYAKRMRDFIAQETVPEQAWGRK